MPPKPSKSKPDPAGPPSTPKTISGFTVLALTLPTLACLKFTTTSLSTPIKHCLYIKPHEPKTPSPDDAKSLFIANVPIDADEGSIRSLFQEHLGGAKVARVEFDASVPGGVVYKRWRSEGGVGNASAREEMRDAKKKGMAGGRDGGKEQRGKKRKRDEEIVAEGVIEDEKSALPKIWPAELRKSGSGAVVVFVDKASARGAMKEVKRAGKEGREVAWKGAEGLGVQRYKSHHHLQYPPKSVLQASITSYLTQFSTAELARNRLRSKLRSVPDEDGFITVVRGGRAGPARLEDAEKKKEELEERKKKNGVREDFYRFQMRERRKEKEGELRRKFEGDRRRVEEMRERRGKVRLEG
ncbi:uncharacterized protein BDR25DRAFT_331638 [Lindgomyces ingoldianus]|uniref:Uncharacterized protein n=1 Tax=Lindgomyces ingoldianus TaxID=673940 RepID=A0ACB6RC30_9PLEO|nr:uncharacterized protein BDR25DRAFT_331638 [Lindgomyces ingoldianus]KAF2476031.1 hypothetical protein BDR25DRAFT_331638 [Lindgomyces ingoldianus]